MHLLPITLENETFITDDNGESFCVWGDICWTLSLDLNVSHKVFEFFALFCHIKDKHWEQLFIICRVYIWRRNQLFNIVKLCSERRGIYINPWKFLLSKVHVVVINLRVSTTIQHHKHVSEITVIENWWVVFLVSRFICLKSYDYQSEVSLGLILLTSAKWNFSFVELRSSRIESFGNQLGDLILIQLFCIVQVFLDHLEAHEAYTKKALTKQPFQHHSQRLWKSRHYHPFLREWKGHFTLSYERKGHYHPFLREFLIVITKLKDVFQRDSEWKWAFWVRLLNDINFSECKTIIPIISGNWSVCAIIFEPQLVEAFRFLKIIWKFQQPKHRCCLARVKQTFNFLPWKLVFYVVEKMHHGVVC